MMNRVSESSFGLCAQYDTCGSTRGYHSPAIDTLANGPSVCLEIGMEIADMLATLRVFDPLAALAEAVGHLADCDLVNFDNDESRDLLRAANSYLEYLKAGEKCPPPPVAS